MEVDAAPTGDFWVSPVSETMFGWSALMEEEGRTDKETDLGPLLEIGHVPPVSIGM